MTSINHPVGYSSRYARKNVTVYLVLLVILFFSSAIIKANGPIVFTQALFDRVRASYGESAQKRVQDWQEVIQDNEDESLDEQLYNVNRFFNQVEFVDDIKHWKKTDYWATPIEFLSTNAGDCEDFSIAKYFTLRALGVPDANLRLMYVKALRLNQAHMVLAYYATEDAIPLVLDNINPRILPASRRRDLLPIYSFNGNGLWLARSQGRGKQVQSGGNNSLWNDLNNRIEQGK
jgi:predicted transglutaminase-like cysteine proteinase